MFPSNPKCSPSVFACCRESEYAQLPLIQVLPLFHLHPLAQFKLESLTSIIASKAQFLKVAIMQVHDFAKWLRICSKFGRMKAKQKKITQISCFFCKNLTEKNAFFTHFSAQSF